MDFVHGIHAFDNMPESGESLTIRVSLPAEIEFRLIADAD